MNRKNRKQRKLKFIILTLVVILILIVLTVAGYKLFTIQKTETQGYLSCTGDLKPDKLNKLLGQNIFLLNTGNLEKELQELFLCLKKLSFIKEFPNRVKVIFEERKPKVIFLNVVSEAIDSARISELAMNNATPSAAAVLQALQKKDSFLVDEDGVLYAKSKGENLPTIYSLTNLYLGQKMDKNIVDKLLKAISQMNTLNMNTSNSLLNSDNTYLLYSNPVVYFNLNGNIDFQIASLQLILRTAKIDSNVEFIDLRFDKPIVKYNNGKR